MRIIGLHGPKRSGKDTAAAGLTAQGWLPVAFAEVLREALVTIDPLLASGLRLHHLLDHLGWEGAKSSPYAAELRRLMAATGDAMRALRPAIFIETTLAKIDAARTADLPGVVVTDVRFPNEALALIAHGASIVALGRPGVTFDRKHASERPLPPELIFSTIRNDATELDLHRQVVFLAERVAA